MRYWMKRVICLVIGMCLMLAGCTPPPDDEAQVPDQPGQTDGGDGHDAMGRYVEQLMSLPEGDAVPRIEVGRDGTLMLYNPQQGCLIPYESDDGQQWEQIEAGVAEELSAYTTLNGFLRLECVTQAPNGDLYALYYDEEYLPHIVRCAGAGTPEDIAIEGWDQTVSPEWMDVLDGGDLVVGYMDKIVRYGSDGNEKMRYDATGISFTVKENQIIHNNNTMDAIVISDLDSGNVLSTVSYPDVWESAMDTSSGSLAAMDETGALYIVNHGGIHRLAPGGSLWETVVDGSLTSLGAPSAEILALLLDGQGGFYVVIGNQQDYSLAHYTYSSETSSVPGDTISIYALQDNETVRQAVGEFQRAHPDYQVDFRYGLSGSTAASITDLIRTLNTELLAGKGPDVLLLDGLPVDSYIEKGVLLDMGSVLNPMIESGVILPNIAAAYAQNGTVYTIPTRIAFPVMIGSTDTVGSLSSLKALADAVTKSGDANYLSVNTSKGRVAEFYITCSPAWMNADGTIQEQALADFLTDIKRIGDVTGDGQYVPEPVPGDAPPSDVDELGYIGGNFASMFDYCRGDTRLNMQMLSGFIDLLFPVSAKEQTNGRIVPLCGQSGNVFAPRGIVGVNNASPKRDMALDYVKILLGEEVQATDLSDGFPVNANALEKGIHNTEMEGYCLGVGGPDGQFMAEWPSQEEMQKIGDMIKSLDTPSTVDPVLLEMILDGSEAFFSGEETAAQAAHAIAERTQAYLTE